MKWSVIIVGGGHAGSEAALISAKLGLKVLMLTGAFDRIASISCNPAIGGVGKGQLVKEIDALGGYMAKAADKSGINFHVLNSSKGAAVRSTRCQIDLDYYRMDVVNEMAKFGNLSIMQAEVSNVIIKNGKVIGVKIIQGDILLADYVILCTGTFMNGRMYLGDCKLKGGRAGDLYTVNLSTYLKDLGFKMGRLKTGTCPRLDARSINFSMLEEQYSQDPAPMFSFLSQKPLLNQLSCYVGYTNCEAHRIIHSAVLKGLSPIYNGDMYSKGPRYCPSIEDKIEKFPNKTSHLIFFEPHGVNSFEIYANGLSTSLPSEVQIKFLRSIKGLEKVMVTRWGYAVEYDFVDPMQLDMRLAVNNIKGLFLAGQINGTTGYEEAAAQGLIAGINVALEYYRKDPLILHPYQAYIGVMINDLVNNGTEEPYRMLTSRVEYRLILREDNVYKRLMVLGRQIGSLSAMEFDTMSNFEDQITNPTLVGCDNKLENRKGIEEKYSCYIERMQKEIKLIELDGKEAIPRLIFEMNIPGLSSEMMEKIKRRRPRTFYDLANIDGVTPTTQSIIRIIKKKMENNI